MAEDNGPRRLNRRYANARDVRRKLVLAHRDQGVHTREIAQLAGVTTRRVRQILA